MALQNVGPIKLSELRNEFGGTDPVRLSDYYGGGALVPSSNTNVPTSGVIKLSDFYGATAVIDPPVLSSPVPDIAGVEDDPTTTLFMSGYFSGADTFTLVGNPTGVTITGTLLSIDWTLVPVPFSGNITVQATNAGGTTSDTFLLTVAAANNDIKPVSFNNVVYLTNMDNSANDLSNAGQTVVNNAPFVIPSSNQSFLGTRVADIDSNADGIEIPNYGIAMSWPGNFCMEGWFYPTGQLGSQFSGLFGSKGTTTTGPGGGMALYRMHNSGNVLALRIVQQDGSGFDVNVNGSTGMSLNNWHHVAMTRSGSTLRVFLNGLQQISTSYSATLHSETGRDFYIGRTDSTAQNFIGEVGPCRFVKGEALYTSNFTPPVNPFPTS